MASLRWEDFEDVFAFDGAGLDVFVAEADLEAWQRVWDVLRQGKLTTNYFQADEPVPLPEDVMDAFPDEGWADRVLAVTSGGVTFNCHFFALDEIEFDLDPREVKGQAQLDAIVAFMRVLAEAAGEDVILTEENAHEDPILQVSPGVDGAEDLRGG